MPEFISNNNNKINYQTWGDSANPAIVFSNSLGTNFSMWQPQIDYFKKDYFVIGYDTRGHGASATSKGPYSLEQLGEDVINLLNHLTIKKANFCGISMGGITGLWLAIYYPERFSTVTVANTAAKIGREDAWLIRAEQVRQTGLLPIAQTAAARWFTEPFVKQCTDVVKHLSDELMKGDAEGYASCCDALASADVRSQLSQITIPLQVIAGIQDPVTTIDDGQYIVDHVKGSLLFKIDASHISNIERADDFNRALSSFIK